MDKPLAATRRIVIAIDGPAGSGKSTLAALLARKFHYINIETGAMYRALAYNAMQLDLSLDVGSALASLAKASQIELVPRPEGNRVELDGDDLTDELRSQQVTEAASRASVHPPVREWMVQRQREIGAAGGIVMEGRDIGTKVFPDAEVKIFLDADPAVRGSRRFQQNPAAAEKQASVVAELRARDERDRTRANSPLVAAADAVHIDSTNLTLDQVVAEAVAIVEDKLAKLHRTVTS
jgi:cytidylate kinase